MYRAVTVMRHGRRPSPGGGERLEMPALKTEFAAEAEPGRVVCSAKSCVICAYHRKKHSENA